MGKLLLRPLSFVKRTCQSRLTLTGLDPQRVRGKHARIL